MNLNYNAIRNNIVLLIFGWAVGGHVGLAISSGLLLLFGMTS